VGSSNNLAVKQSTEKLSMLFAVSKDGLEKEYGAYPILKLKDHIDKAK
jgi:hypothetical protein